MMRVLALVVVIVGGLLPLYAHSFDPGYAGFTVSVDGLDNPYHTFALYVMLGEAMELTAPAESDVRSSGAKVKAVDQTSWQITAPMAPGLYPVE